MIESLVSINDKGKRLGDPDMTTMMHHSNLINVVSDCPHGQGEANCGNPTDGMGLSDLISVDSWDEFFDLPSETVVVWACGNWQARLAMTAASVQRSKPTLVLPNRPCLDCLQTYQGVGKT